MLNIKKLIFLQNLALILSMCNTSQDLSAQKVGVLGTGYVGLVVGSCFADLGNDVICADIDKEKIKTLNNGKIPIYEEGLEELVKFNTKSSNLKFTNEVEKAIQDSKVIFIAVGTPMNKSGKANLKYIKEVAKLIGQNLNNYKVIVTKSTVPIGTGEKIKHTINKYNSKNQKFDLVSNPEFLREGSAVKDFKNPDRIVLGLESEKSLKKMNKLYEPFFKSSVPIIYTNIPTAETIKYVSNSFLALKVAYINEIANLCETTGADIIKTAEGIGLDKRIGKEFLKPGPGFGGSCFPKDIQALIHKAKTCKSDLTILQSAFKSNEKQKENIFKKFLRLSDNSLENKTIAVLGLAFKSNTDDIRDSASVHVIKNLLKAGAKVKAYDPVAVNNTKKLFPNIEYCDSAYQAIEKSDGVIILTDWPEFKNLDLKQVKSLLNSPVLLDARNIISTKDLKNLEFSYENIGNAEVFNF